MTIKGSPDQKKSSTVQFATVGPVREQQNALDVIAHIFHQLIATDAAETGSTTTSIKATAHAAFVGDLISWTSGTLDTREYRVASIPDADHIGICEAMAVAPANGDTFAIMRAKVPVVSDDGELTVGVTFANDTDYGVVGANTLRTAAQVGNATGAAAFGAGAVSAQVLRTTPASDSPHLLATRHEAAATPVATRAGNGSAFAAFGAGANAADVPRTTPATDAPHLLATRHEAVTTPLAFRLTDGTDFLITAALAAAQKTISTATKMLTTLAVSVGWDGTTHREIAVDTSGNVKVANLPATADTNTGAAGASTLRTVLATRHEAVATPLAVVQSNGSAAVDYSAGAATSATPRVATAATNLAYSAKGKIAGASLTGSYATLLNPTSDLRILAFFNSCNNTILVSLDGGTTDSLELEAGESITLDLAANGLKFDNAVNISAKHGGAAPTGGTIRVSGVG